MLITLKHDPYPNPNYNHNPTELCQTLLTLTDSVGLKCAPSDRHTNYKLLKHTFHCDLHKHFCSARIVNLWNS